MKCRLGIVLLVASTVPTYCWADMWKCVDSNGNTRYMNADPHKPNYDCPGKDDPKKRVIEFADRPGCRYVAALPAGTCAPLAPALLPATKSAKKAEDNTGETSTWTRFGTADEEVIYFSPSTIRKTGNIVKMWVMHDYTVAKIGFDSTAAMSMKAQYEYDCKEDTFRLLYSSQHTEKMGSGKVGYVYTGPDKWRPTPPESVGEALLKRACNRR